MTVSPDLLAQNFCSFQTDKQPAPATIASAATVAPLGWLSFISGTVAIATITPPLTGAHELKFIFTTTTPVAFTTTGNIKYVMTPTQNIPVSLIWNPLENKYYPSEGVV